MKSRPLDSTKSSGPQRARLLLLAPMVLLIVGVLAAFVWWQHYKTTPAYSVALLIDAAQRNDEAALDRLFDMDQVVDTFLSDLAQNTGPGFSSSLHVLVRRGLQSAAPGTMNNAKAAVREGVRQRINELGQSTSDAPFVFTAIALYFKADIQNSGDKAIVKISRDSKTLELAMVRANDHWRVIAAKDDEMAARIMANISKELPSSFAPFDLANPLKEALPQLPLHP